jgi:hypothetical protein
MDLEEIACIYKQTVFNDAEIATNLKYAQNNNNVLHCVIRFLFVPTAKAQVCRIY